MCFQLWLVCSQTSDIVLGQGSGRVRPHSLYSSVCLRERAIARVIAEVGGIVRVGVEVMLAICKTE